MVIRQSVVVCFLVSARTPQLYTLRHRIFLNPNMREYLVGAFWALAGSAIGNNLYERLKDSRTPADIAGTNGPD